MEETRVAEARRRVCRQPITIIMFHSISDDDDPYATTPIAFRRQIEQLGATFSVIRLSEVEEAMREPVPGPRRVVITFDDAFRDFREAAYPVLSEFGLPVAVFVPTGSIGGYNEWDAPHDRIPRRPILSAQDLRELHATGTVEFGSHSVDHRPMGSLAASEMRRQARDSKKALEDILSADVSSFAYPYGQLRDISHASELVLAEAGYRIAVTTHWGTSGTPADLLRLPRIRLRSEDSTATLTRKIRGHYDWIAWKENVAYAVRRSSGRLARRAPGSGKTNAGS